MYGPSPDAGQAGGIASGVVGGVINAAASIYDTYQTNKTSRRNTDRTIAANKAEAELAYQRSVEMWHMQNMYNTPQAQMERFKAAGLNPHLIYGQGNSGNSSNIPNYHPPDIQYKYAAPAYGSAVASVLPTLMSVGTWMQNMRSSEIENQLKMTNTQKAQQMVDYLTEMNPKLLEQKENLLSLYPYQKSLLDAQRGIANRKLHELGMEYRQKYGDELWSYLPQFPQQGDVQRRDIPIGGTKRLEFLLKQSQLEQNISKQKLLEAQASWTDFGITNPQSIMQMVLGGVMGLAGQQLRLSTYKPPRQYRERPRGLVRARMGRNHPDR